MELQSQVMYQKLTAHSRLAMIMQVFSEHVSDKEKQRLRVVYHDLKRKQEITEGAKKLKQYSQYS
jgi:hypothetical protein